MCRFKLCSYFPYKNFGINKLLTAFNPVFPTFPLYVFTKDVFKIHRHVCHISLVLWMYFQHKNNIHTYRRIIYVHTLLTPIPIYLNALMQQLWYLAKRSRDKKHSTSIRKTYLPTYLPTYMCIAMDMLK